MGDAGKEKLWAAKWSVKVNVFILAIKLAAGIYTGSLGILAEFVHSLFDLLASVFAYLGIKKAAEPADKTHHYGHERFENVSGLLQSLLITATSIIILYEAYGKLISGIHIVRESFIGIIVMAVTLVMAIGISKVLHKKSEETGSPALEADAYHFTTDILSTAAVIIGLGAASLGYPVADVLGAIIVALIMLSLSVGLGKKALFVMLDRAPDGELLERITSVISEDPKVRGYHSLRARTAGGSMLVDVSLHLEDNISLEQAHKISEALEKKIKAKCPGVKDIVIHIEPEKKHD